MYREMLMEPLIDIIVFVIAGIIGGFIGSIFGIGGGLLTTPILMIIGYDSHVAVSASLLAMVGTMVSGLNIYERKVKVHYDYAIYAEAIGIPGIITGLFIATAGIKYIVKYTLAGALIMVSMDLLRTYGFKYKTAEEACIHIKKRPVLAYTLMYFAGIVSVLAGIGMGILMVPILARLLGVDVKESIATSLLLVGITSATGALGYYIVGYLRPCSALALLSGSTIGGVGGSMTGVRLSGRTTMIGFAIFLIFMAFLVIVRAGG